MLNLHARLALPDVMAFVPEAAGNSWWRDSFLAPLAVQRTGPVERLSVVEALLDDLEDAGFGAERIALVGFSQGACLVLEAAARLARPFHAVAALSGGLVGTARGWPAARRPLRPNAQDVRLCRPARRRPVLIGCHERDPHIPLARVRESGGVLGHMGAEVETRIFPGAGHGIVAEEMSWLRGWLNAAQTGRTAR